MSGFQTHTHTDRQAKKEKKQTYRPINHIRKYY